MAPKRKASTQGRSRCNTQSTYAASLDPRDRGRGANQACGIGASPSSGATTPNPTLEQLLQQLQGELQRAQQERDRLAVASVTNQRATLMTQQVAEVRQQLTILQAENQMNQTNPTQPLAKSTTLANLRNTTQPGQTNRQQIHAI